MNTRGMVISLHDRQGIVHCRTHSDPPTVPKFVFVYFLVFAKADESLETTVDIPITAAVSISLTSQTTI